MKGRLEKGRRKPNTDKGFRVIPRVSPALVFQHMKSMTYLEKEILGKHTQKRVLLGVN